MLIRPKGDDRECEVTNKKHAFDGGLTGVLEELLDGFMKHFAGGDDDTRCDDSLLAPCEVDGTISSLQLLLEILCSFTHWRKGTTPGKNDLHVYDKRGFS